MQKCDKLDGQNSQIEIELKMVRQEQSRMLTSFYDLESRYKEIMKENMVMKNELQDLRSNKSLILNKRSGDYMDLPLNKTADKGFKVTTTTVQDSNKDITTDEQSKESLAPGLKHRVTSGEMNLKGRKDKKLSN